jgi:pyruvate,water dikinase
MTNGIGLARLEFIIANQIKAHPLALLHYPNLKTPQGKEDLALCAELEKLTIGYRKKDGSLRTSGFIRGMKDDSKGF